MKILGSLLLIFTLLITTNTPASAQNEGRWYNVEIVIFKRVDGAQQTRENWRKDIALTYPEFYRYLSSSSGENFGRLEQKDFLLGSYDYTLRRDENYQILFHQAWTQQMQNEAESPGIIVEGGKTINQRPELSGHIKIHIGRYLHLTTDLWLSHFAPDSIAADWPVPPASPSSDNRSGLAGELLINSGSSSPIATMRERRRMRSNELHYIDHPLMGLLILITPLDKSSAS